MFRFRRSYRKDGYMIETKSTNRIEISKELEKKEHEKFVREKLIKNAERAIDSFNDLLVSIETCWNDNIVLTFNDDRYVLYPEFNLIVVKGAKELDLLKGEQDALERKMKKEVLEKMNLSSELLSYEEAKKIYFEYPYESRVNKYKWILCKKSKKVGYIAEDGKFEQLLKRNNEVDWGLMFDSINFVKTMTSICKVRVPCCHHLPCNLTKLEIFLKYNLKPKELKEMSLMNNLSSLVKKGFVSVDKDKISLTETGKSAVLSGECKKIGNVGLSEESLNYKDIKINIAKASVEQKKEIYEYYLKCDAYRANMAEYDLKRMEDPNMGHWELWDGNERPGVVTLSDGNNIIARNPKSDIQEDSIDGIDFGTKSTVVVYQNETGDIKPMPIGCDDIRRKLSTFDFENPTVLQFINLGSFLKKYKEKEGRPYTLWRDLIVSHAANESLKDAGIRSEEFYSFMYDLKQWAGEGNQKVIIRDKSGKDTVLRAYREIIVSEKDANVFDPIELYAYFIGLYVNNMNNGIYLDYLLSFPVTYEKCIRDAILRSFRKGLKKSLPESLQRDKDILSKFNVEAGVSEPAAYAICALESYGFEPEADENIFYAIFDFGGGTSDFDFGLWTSSKNEDIYDYRIEHFGSEGDRYLGGENLLQLIAFDVFGQNIDICRKEEIPFSRPLEMKDISVELKGYVNNSQEARINLKLMMEKLRPFWERSSDIEEDDKFDPEPYSEFQIGLFNTYGELKPNLKFNVDTATLERILSKRIDKGVRQFFNALKGIFGNKYLSKTHNVEQINIFLAGNASKSPILQKIFKDKIKEWSSQIGKKSKVNKDFCVLYPPLGSKASLKIMENRGIVPEFDLESPTGKTGVAWGLIEGRKGGRIEIVEEITSDTEAKFAYYLGISVRKKFKMRISRETEYNKWIQFIPATKEKIEINYTTLPEATNGNLSERDENVMRKRIALPEYGDGKFVYIRLIGREQIEIAVGDEEMNINESLTQIITL